MRMMRLERYRAHCISQNLEATYLYVLAACWQQAAILAQEEIHRRYGQALTLEHLECLAKRERQRRPLPPPSRRVTLFD
ncbi:hypothetical protein [Salinicola aestuarinus]|uniref:hypothetical protein n=1 Tax=Salinicola aestuarinus TaxID=1949082 RepID=UPI0013009C6F|nr:hypothetical protein [Salinicola aestuarinus]